MVDNIKIKNKSGPKGPTKPLTDDDFKKLIALIRIHCTSKEVCSVLGMSRDTLNRRLKSRGEHDFSTLFEKYRDEGKASLRRLQWKSAESGNTSLLIWLGKQYLDQKDARRTELTGADGKPLNVNAQTIKFDLSGRTPEELAQIQKTLLMLKGAVIENIKSDED